MKLEKGEVEWIRLCNKERIRYAKKMGTEFEKEAAATSDPESGELGTSWIPNDKRPTHRTGPLRLIGKKDAAFSEVLCECLFPIQYDIKEIEDSTPGSMPTIQPDYLEEGFDFIDVKPSCNPLLKVFQARKLLLKSWYHPAQLLGWKSPYEEQKELAAKGNQPDEVVVIIASPDLSEAPCLVPQPFQVLAVVAMQDNLINLFFAEEMAFWIAKDATMQASSSRMLILLYNTCDVG
ncbi:hypothetical protein ACHAPK_011491 [Fusarium culmorum]